MAMNPAQQAQGKDDDTIDLSALIAQVRENKWLVVIVTLVFMTLGLLYAWRQAPLFQSSVLLQISNKQDTVSGLLGGTMSGLVGGRGGFSDNPESRLMALIKSKYILAPVVHSLGLDIDEQESLGWFRKYLMAQKASHLQIASLEVPFLLRNEPLKLTIDKTNNFKLYSPDGALLLEGAAGSLVRSSDKSVSLKLDAPNLSHTATYWVTKHSAANVIQQLQPKLNIKDLGGRDSTGVLDVSLIGTNPEKVIQILNQIAKTAQENDAKRKSLEASKTLSFLYQQLPLTKLSLEKSEAELNAYRAKSGKIDIKIQSQALLMQLSELEKQLGTLRLNKVDMLQRFTNEHPTMVAFNLQVNALEAQISQLEHQLKTLPASDQQAVSLMRDVEVKNTLYLLLLNKIQELRVIKAGTVSDVSILSKAAMPDAPLASKSALIAFGSMLLGLMMSGLIIFVRQLLFHRVDDPLWSEKHFNIVNLAIIPYSKEQQENDQNFKTHVSRENPLLAHTNPRNLAIESLRGLRTSLQVNLSCASNNIISIMGISPSIGKSFISSNLAYLLASAGKRVLLIDGDLRRGLLHTKFNEQPSPGINEIINHKVEVNQALREVHPNLTFLARGVYAEDPSELLMGDDFKNLIKTLSQQFDIVVIDTAPVLLVTDAVVIGTMSATNYLVMGAKMHHASDIEVVVKRLANAGVHIHGSIFNFFNSQSNSSYYYGKYQYSAYYSAN
jgi:tyrosine-protein kinase Etk/Wzc